MQMNWWADEPIIFVREGDLECNRVRLLVAEKKAGCAIRMITANEIIPEFLEQLNPDGIYPLLVCKELACYGYALEELLHERYEKVRLLPRDLIKRAQLRLLSEMVRSWYRLPALQLRLKLEDLASMFDASNAFFASPEISILDIAIAALLFDLPRLQYWLTPGAPFTGYVRMMIGRPAFDVLPRPHLPYIGARGSPAPRLEGAA
jgi:glutathione S-transferase